MIYRHYADGGYRELERQDNKRNVGLHNKKLVEIEPKKRKKKSKRVSTLRIRKPSISLFKENTK